MVCVFRKSGKKYYSENLKKLLNCKIVIGNIQLLFFNAVPVHLLHLVVLNLLKKLETLYIIV